MELEWSTFPLLEIISNLERFVSVVQLLVTQEFGYCR